MGAIRLRVRHSREVRPVLALATSSGSTTGLRLAEVGEPEPTRKALVSARATSLTPRRTAPPVHASERMEAEAFSH